MSNIPAVIRHRPEPPRRGEDDMSHVWFAGCSCGLENAGTGSTPEEAAVQARAHAATARQGDDTLTATLAKYAWLGDTRNLPERDLSALLVLFCRTCDELTDLPHAAAWLWNYMARALWEERRGRMAVEAHVEADLAGGHVRLRTIPTDDDDGYVSSCLCRWESDPQPTETDAEASLDEHIEEFWRSVPEGMNVRGSWCQDGCDGPDLDVTCSRCQKVRYIGPDCEHVPQPLPVSADGVCTDCMKEAS